MLNWNLPAAYQGPVGSVSSGNISAALWLMGMGMLGIFTVMLLIYLMVHILNKVTGKSGKKTDQDDD